MAKVVDLKQETKNKALKSKIIIEALPVHISIGRIYYTITHSSSLTIASIYNKMKQLDKSIILIHNQQINPNHENETGIICSTKRRVIKMLKMHAATLYDAIGYLGLVPEFKSKGYVEEFDKQVEFMKELSKDEKKLKEYKKESIRAAKVPIKPKKDVEEKLDSSQDKESLDKPSDKDNGKIRKKKTGNAKKFKSKIYISKSEIAAMSSKRDKYTPY
jgi:hypothetical protein